MRFVWAGLIGAAACSAGEPPAEFPNGSLDAEWTGADTGKLSAPAVAEWCEGLKLLELRAIRGDTGIALVLYPSGAVTAADSISAADSIAPDSATPPGSATPGDSVTPGLYPVVAPAWADSSRPSAAVAMRWFAETSIRGFRGDTGTVVFEATGPGTSAGRFSAYLRSATEGSKLWVTGSFKGLSITPAPQDCVGRPGEGSDDPDDESEDESGESDDESDVYDEYDEYDDADSEPLPETAE